MPKYIIEETYTGQAMAGLLQNPEDRTEAVRPLYEAVGGRLEQYYVSLTENKVFLIVNVPDQANLVALIMANFAGGPLTSYRISPIITASEGVELFKKAATVAYRPPGK